MSTQVDNIATCYFLCVVRRATNAKQAEVEPFSKAFRFELVLSGAIAYFEGSHFMHTPVT
jgi:hypothetical protein